MGILDFLLKRNKKEDKVEQPEELLPSEQIAMADYFEDHDLETELKGGKK